MSLFHCFSSVRSVTLTLQEFSYGLKRILLVKVNLGLMRSATQHVNTAAVALKQLCQVWENNPDDVIKVVSAELHIYNDLYF